MSTRTAAAPTYADGTSTTVREAFRRNRGLIAVGIVLVLAAVVVALAQGRRGAGFLDPDGFDPSGSHAVATLLEQQGVTVVRVTTAHAATEALRAADGRATLLVAPTAPLSERMLAEVSGADRLRTVLVAPDASVLEVLAPVAQPGDYSTSTDEIPAGCDWWLAQRTGPLPAEGLHYTVPTSQARSCWDGLVLDDSNTRDELVTTVVGAAQAFTNDRLADSGYAALALNTLGHSPTLVWWLPSWNDPLQTTDGGSQPDIGDLVPRWVGWALLQLALAVLVVVWWRARRLGRVVVEPLPVVVRPTEAVEGRARLYRRGHARGRAADALREATVRRLRSRLGLPRGSDLADVVAAVSARTGRSPLEIESLLSPGGEPADDTALTLLADELDTLENEVRRS